MSDYVPMFDCAQCLDEPAGWIVLRCTGNTCGRRKDHGGAHTFAVRCPCWLKKHADDIRHAAEALMQSGKEPSDTYDALVAVMNNRYPWQRATTIAAEDRRVKQAVA